MLCSLLVTLALDAGFEYENNPKDFVQRFSRLEGEEAFADVTFVIHAGCNSLEREDEEMEKEKEQEKEDKTTQTMYRLNRCILFARSVHFRSMFSSGLKETDQDTIHFYDVNPATFALVSSFFFVCFPFVIIIIMSCNTGYRISVQRQQHNHRP